MDIAGGTWSVVLMGLFQLTAQALALVFSLYCYTKYKTKGWRFLALVVWTSISIVATLITLSLSTGLILPPGSMTPHTAIHWVNHSVAIIGYLSVVTTCWAISSYYKGLGYGK